MKRYIEPFFIFGSVGKFHPSYKRCLPPLEYFDEALDTPRQEVVNFYKNIDDKAELYLREKLNDIMRELKEHRSNKEVHYSDKKRNKDYY